MAKGSTALTKLKKIEGMRLQAAARARAAAKATWETQQHTLLAGGSAFGIGFAENRGMALPTFDAVDPVVVYSAAAFGLTFFVKDKRMRRMLEGITDGLLGVTAYKAGKYGFNSLFSYAKPAAVPTPEAATAGWGEEIIETGAF